MFLPPSKYLSTVQVFSALIKNILSNHRYGGLGTLEGLKS